MKPEDSTAYLRQVMHPLCRVFPDLAPFEACLDLQAQPGYSFYDSMVIAAAIRGPCRVL
jgi:hypothetical protein